MISKWGYRVWAISRAFQPIRSACGIDKALIQGFEVDDRYPSSNKYGKLPISTAGEIAIRSYRAS
jgi:hypothetical protein